MDIIIEYDGGTSLWGLLFVLFLSFAGWYYGLKLDIGILFSFSVIACLFTSLILAVAIYSNLSASSRYVEACDRVSVMSGSFLKKEGLTHISPRMTIPLEKKWHAFALSQRIIKRLESDNEALIDWARDHGRKALMLSGIISLDAGRYELVDLPYTSERWADYADSLRELHDFVETMEGQFD